MMNVCACAGRRIAAVLALAVAAAVGPALALAPPSEASAADSGRVATGLTWAVQHPANPDGATSVNLNGISCASPRLCTAVGDFPTGAVYGNTEVTTATLAERWNGARWARQPTPNPPSSVQSALAGVACPSARRCQAVGYELTSSNDTVPVAEQWNGKTWAIETLAKKGPVGTTYLFGVSCPAASSCVAVGYFDDDLGQADVLAEAWNGATWAVQPTTAAAASGSLFDVSCLSPTDCVAVGTANSGAPLAEKWDGTRWFALHPVGHPGAVDVTLDSVACATDSNCISSGYYITASYQLVPITQAWNGKRWKEIPPPARSAGGSISTVSCGSPAVCLGVGSSTGASRTLAATWDGTAWTIASGSVSGSLGSVSCTAATRCVATGSGSSGVMSRTWNGRGWHTRPFPPIAGATQSDLSGVSCSSVTTCTAVGSYWTGGSVVTLAQTWNAGKWAVQPTPNPKGSKNTELTSVSCPSAAMCAAIGSYVVSNPFYKSMTEIWDGTDWAIERVASPGKGASEISLSSVSCASTMRCVAVGAYQNSAGIEKSLTEVWDGSTWAFVGSPNPSGEEVSFLAGVSCRSADFCVAVGGWSSIRQVRHTLAEGWNGRQWVIEPTPTAGADTNDTLDAVSCATTSDCVAVGGAAGATVAEAWNGSSWTRQPTPKLTGYSSLAGISCPAASSCTAVGSTAGTPLAEGWDGSSWTVQATPSLPAGGSFAAVSCADPARCAATGQTANPAGTPVMLTERSRPARFSPHAM